MSFIENQLFCRVFLLFGIPFVYRLWPYSSDIYLPYKKRILEGKVDLCTSISKQLVKHLRVQKSKRLSVYEYKDGEVLTS